MSLDCLVASMWRPLYQKEADRFASQLPEHISTTHMSADRTDRAALMARIAHGVPFLVYFGHGHGKGWTGFRGVRPDHFPSRPDIPPIGCVLSFSCAPLGREDSFGARLVDEGKVGTFIGPAAPLKIVDLPALADLFASLLCHADDPNTLLTRARQKATTVAPGLAGALKTWCTCGPEDVQRPSAGFLDTKIRS